ncbi:MAG: hypothetical protein OEM58_08045 [Nitrospirota bacterium]|nr:hypothetical protein [Nitrospirota bacterium]
MKRFSQLMGLILVIIFWGGCEMPQFQTLKVLDHPNRVVALQVMSDAYGGKGYEHPVTMTAEDMIRILQGVRVEHGLLGTSQHPAFSDTEIGLFAPYFVEGLKKATPEEIVTFFETAHLDSENDLTTSGGLFVAGGNLYIVLSNFSVKTRAWQDNERYEASYRNRPLEQMDPQPGRLVFEPGEFMVESPDGEIGSRFKGKPWQVAVRYKELLQKTSPLAENK